MLSRSNMLLLLRWWIEQLSELLPPHVLAWFLRAPDAVLIVPEAAGITVAVRRRGTVADLCIVAAPADLQLVSTALRRHGKLPRTVLLAPRAAWVLQKTIRLPRAAYGDLDRLLAYEMARETPFDPQELYWSHAVGRHSGGDSLAVAIALVPRERLAAAIQLAIAVELAPAAVELPVADGAVRTLPLDEARARGRPRLARRTALAAALAFLAIAMPVIRQSMALADAEERLAAAKAGAAEAGRLRLEMERLSRVAGFLADERRRAGSPLATLAATTRVIPDDTYLATLSVRAGRIAMTGVSADAAGLIERLANSPAFRDPAFAGPVVRAPGSALESFALSAALNAVGTR